ncbi:putative GIY-YIG catalytic domain-containing protein [Rosellinia necatrix]|uniref:Putative GIY-YIG catalytic domain-containing protein n=1 Tax=Rosellinia necatrix TaxID=77044 RepID=A0A1W2TWH9_ROSNE|nr:putative GIY-YIG catalytic domain-containing protein [Rosellinia necatrix]
MPALSKPIPPLYTVYFLRSTVSHRSLYIGSTPNPPRRLKQHNGESKGGAARTSRRKLRPWEMVGLVSGFPGMVAALKFEWALNNPHVSLHIPTASRITMSKQRKRNGCPKRPPHSVASILSNVHLLLRVPSFARWPLTLHFFAPEVHRAWTKYCSTVTEPLRETISIYTDFAPSETSVAEGESAEPPRPWGIHALPADYAPMKSYVEKTRSLYSFEREGACVVCGEDLLPGEGLYATCSNDGCGGTGHLSCWSRHLLGANAGEHIVPVSGRCPECQGEVVWGDMMKEMSLRLRGQKDVDKLLKKPRKAKASTTADSS